MPRAFHVVCLLVFLAVLAHSQSSQPPATVTFTLDFPASQPARYSLQIQSDGKARYESTGKVSSESDQVDSFDYEFMVSPATREKIFELSAKAGFFQRT